MPTGYTADIKDGITFEKFALNCARAFGALVMMRDEPSDAEIPNEFKPSTYHISELEKANKRLVLLQNLTPELIEKCSRDDYKKSVEDWERYSAERDDLKEKYTSMLLQVVKWEPPTEDHKGLKKFMLQQIRDSIKWDCEHSKPPELLTPDQWLEKEINSAKWHIEHHTNGNEDEIRRAKESTEWTLSLKKSLRSGTESKSERGNGR